MKKERAVKPKLFDIYLAEEDDRAFGFAGVEIEKDEDGNERVVFKEGWDEKLDADGRSRLEVNDEEHWEKWKVRCHSDLSILYTHLRASLPLSLHDPFTRPSSSPYP